MPTDWKRINRELAEKRENLWDGLNAGSDGAYQQRVRVLLDEQPEINRLDARIKTLAEEGCSLMGRIGPIAGVSGKDDL